MFNLKTLGSSKAVALLKCFLSPLESFEGPLQCFISPFIYFFYLLDIFQVPRLRCRADCCGSGLPASLDHAAISTLTVPWPPQLQQLQLQLLQLQQLQLQLQQLQQLQINQHQFQKLQIQHLQCSLETKTTTAAVLKLQQLRQQLQLQLQLLLC